MAAAEDRVPAAGAVLGRAGAVRGGAGVRRQPYHLRITAATVHMAAARPRRATLYATGALRVLYADDDIRIFTNRADSPDRWESEGLVVVQVRDELFA